MVAALTALLLGAASAHSAVPTSEVLLTPKAAGPYDVSVEGERMTDRAYLAIDVALEGRAVPDATRVEVVLDPPDELTRVDERAGTQRHVARRVEAEGSGPVAHYLVPDLDLQAFSADFANWVVTVRVQGPAGEGATSFGLQVYPAKPGTPWWFDAANVALPIVVVVMAAAAFARRGTPLQVPVRRQPS